MEKDNIMGTLPINKLLITISGPIIISMMIQALYNVVDSFFVAKISEDALAAVSLAFPMQNIMIGVSTGTAIGIGANLSKALGEKNQKRVNDFALNGIFLCVLSVLFFMILGVTTAKSFMSMQTDVDNIIESGTVYLRICTFFSAGIFGEIIFQRLLQATGKTFYSMLGQLTGALTNIILDPILIFGLFGMPKLGITGAAIATVIGQIGGAAVTVIFNLKVNREIQFNIREFKPSVSIIKEIYSIGVPAMINNSLMPIMAFGMNRILIGFSTSATAIMGVFIKLQSFIFMPVIGMNNGLISIVAFNYGSRKKDRIIGSIKMALKYSLLFTGAGTVAFQIFTGNILRLFLAETKTLEMGVVAFRIISITFIISGFTFILCAVFQALGKSILSLIVQGLRQLALLLPMAYILSLLNNLDMVWLAFPFADVIALIICLLIYLRISKKIIHKLEN